MLLGCASQGLQPATPTLFVVYCNPRTVDSAACRTSAVEVLELVLDSMVALLDSIDVPWALVCCYP